MNLHAKIPMDHGYQHCRFVFLKKSFSFLHFIDYDPQVIEQKEQSRPQCLPLSYVLRFITDAARREGPFLGTSGAELKRKLAIKHHSYSMSSSNRSNTPTGDSQNEYQNIVVIRLVQAAFTS